jgi:hypothetical protein
VIAELDTAEKVHAAMLRGAIATISMRQCAHVHGEATMKEFNRWDELRGDLQTVEEVLREYEGESAWEKAQEAIDHVTVLRAQAEGLRSALLEVQNMLERCRKVMEANDPLNARAIFGREQGDGHGEQARQTSGPSGTV